MFGPTGIGALYGKSDDARSDAAVAGRRQHDRRRHLREDRLPGPPARFEAGTGNIADAVGLGAALDYVERIGMANIAAYEHELLELRARSGCATVPGLRMIGTARDKAGVLSFVLDVAGGGVGAALDREGIAVRAGHHCAQPILRRFGLETTVRPSLALYNTPEDVDALIAALHRLSAERGKRGL